MQWNTKSKPQYIFFNKKKNCKKTKMKLIAWTLVAVLVAIARITFVEGAWCNDQSNVTGPPNNFPIIQQPPKLLGTVANGKLFQVGDPFDKDTGGAYTYVLHLYGSDPYQWGFAQGTLLKNEVTAVLTTAWAYFKSQVEQAINGTANQYDIPQSVVQWLAEVGLEAALDYQYDQSLPFIDPNIFTEMKGLSDASGLDYDTVRRIHFIGEITKGRCSFYGAWGKATAKGNVLNLRSLDWDTGAMLQNYPVLTVYHPQQQMGHGVAPAGAIHVEAGRPRRQINKNGAANAAHAFVNVAWAGWLGVLTAASEKQIGIGEIGVSYPDYPPAFGDESMVGIPFVFLLRDIAQYTNSFEEAETLITNANRTCHLMMGLIDGNARTGRAVQYSHSIVRFFDDTNLEPYAPWHLRIEDVVYEAMDWACPFYQNAMHRQLTNYYGQLTPEISIRNVTSNVMTVIFMLQSLI